MTGYDLMAAEARGRKMTLKEENALLRQVGDEMAVALDTAKRIIQLLFDIIENYKTETDDDEIPR